MKEVANGTAFSFSERELRRLDDALMILLEKLEESKQGKEIESWYAEWSQNQSPAFQKELKEQSRIAIYMRTRVPGRSVTSKND